MKINFEQSLDNVLKHEGGFQKDVRDSGNANGGMTNLGCTKAVWEEHCGHPVDEKAMRALTPADVGPLYKRKYWDKVQGDELPSGIDYVVFDAAINSGAGRAAKWLQACVGVEPDGGIGPKTLEAVRAVNPEQLIKDYSKRRLSFLSDLSTWETFGKGWFKRVNEVEAVGLTLL